MNNLMKGWGRVCLGSLAGAVLGATSFFAIEAVAPSGSTANPAAIGEQFSLQRSYQALCGQARTKCTLTMKDNFLSVNGERVFAYEELQDAHVEVNKGGVFSNPPVTIYTKHQLEGQPTLMVSKFRFLHSQTGLKFWKDILSIRAQNRLLESESDKTKSP